MPKFNVKKGQDAYVVYETTVVADSMEEAEQIAMGRGYDGDWSETGDVREFDDATLMEGETEEVPTEEGDDNAETA